MKKKTLACVLSATIMVTGCNMPSKEDKDNVKMEQVNSQAQEVCKKAKVEVIKGNYEEAEDILALGLLDYTEDKNLVELFRQVRSLNAIVKDIDNKKYEDAFLKCRILLIEENLDDSIKDEVEKLKIEIEKLSGGKLDKDDDKDRNVKIDKNKDISPSKALELALKYSKSTYNKKNMQCIITDMYLVDSKAYYSIYVYNIVLTNDGYYQENPIALLEVEMRTGKVYEVIAYKQQEQWISESSALDKAWSYIKKNGLYKPDYMQIKNIYGEGKNIVYYIEAYDVYYDKDGYENEIYAGYFEVNVISGAVTGYTKKPNVPVEEEEEEDNLIVPPETTEPEVTDPEITEPEITEPEVTQPETTEPEVTEPEITQPEENTQDQPQEQIEQQDSNDDSNNTDTLSETVEENSNI